MQYTTSSNQETIELAKQFAKKFSGKVIALYGDLGAGKTTFVQGFAKGLEITDKIISPTFVLIRQHKIPHSKKIFYHIDLYRLEKDSDFKSLGLSELLDDPNSLVFIEWAEKIEEKLPKNTTRIYIEKLDETKRKVVINN